MWKRAISVAVGRYGSIYVLLGVALLFGGCSGVQRESEARKPSDYRTWERTETESDAAGRPGTEWSDRKLSGHAVGAPLSVAVLWLNSEGVPAVARPDVSRTRGTWTVRECLIPEVIGVLERAYDCGSYTEKGRVYFGGRSARVFLTTEYGSEEQDRVRAELGRLLPSTASVGILGDRVVIAADPADVEQIRGLDLFSSMDYMVTVRLYEVSRDVSVGVQGSLEAGIDGSMGDYSTTLAVALRGLLRTEKAKLLSESTVTVPAGDWGRLEIGQERFFETFTASGEGETFSSGFEERSAGLLLGLQCSSVDDGTVGVRYDVELSSFVGDDRLTRKAQGAIRCRPGREAMAAGLTQEDGVSVAGFFGLNRSKSSRRLALTVTVGGGPAAPGPPGLPDHLATVAPGPGAPGPVRSRVIE